MPARDEVEAQLKAIRQVGGLAASRVWLGRLIGTLSEILREGEPIENWMDGQDPGPYGEETRPALLVATPDRLLHVSPAGYTEFALGEITEVRDKTGLLTGSIEVAGPDRTVRLARVKKGAMKPFADDLRRRIARAGGA